MAMRDSPNAPSQQAVLLLYQNVVVICMPDRFAALAHSESEAETRYYSVTPMNGVTGGTGEVWISPSPQFLPKPLLGGKGWLYLTVLAPPSRARTGGARPWRARLPELIPHLYWTLHLDFRQGI